MVLVEGAPPVETCPEVWLLDADEDVELLVFNDRALVGVPVDRLEPVGEAVLDALLTVLFWVFNDEDEVLPAAEESCVPWVVEEFALEEAPRVVTELAAAVFLPEVEVAALATVVVAAPWT
jgi:hypothetical protein